MDTTTPQETFEPTREQMARVEALSIEHGSVEVKINRQRKLVTVKPTAHGFGPPRTFDENGDEAMPEAVTHVEVDLPVDLVGKLIGDGPLALAIDAHPRSTSDVYDSRPTRVGEAVRDLVVDCLTDLLDGRGA